MAEKSLLNKKAHLNMVLLRPSMIACAHEQPVPGWTDTISAAGILSSLSSMGLIRYLRSPGVNRFDIIPVDTVSNAIIVSSAYCGSKLDIELNGHQHKEGQFLIYNIGSTSKNMITMDKYVQYLMEANRFFELNKK